MLGPGQDRGIPMDRFESLSFIRLHEFLRMGLTKRGRFSQNFVKMITGYMQMSALTRGDPARANSAMPCPVPALNRSPAPVNS